MLPKIFPWSPCQNNVSLCSVWHFGRSAANTWSWFHLAVAGQRLLSCVVVSTSHNTHTNVDGHALHFLLDSCCSDNWEYNIHVTGSWSIIYNELIAKFIYYD